MTPSLPENQSQHGKAVLTENSEAADGREIDQETEEWAAMGRITPNSGLILEPVYPWIIVVGSSRLLRPDLHQHCQKYSSALATEADLGAKLLAVGSLAEQNVKAAVAPVYKFQRFG